MIDVRTTESMIDGTTAETTSETEGVTTVENVSVAVLVSKVLLLGPSRP